MSIQNGNQNATLNLTNLVNINYYYFYFIFNILNEKKTIIECNSDVLKSRILYLLDSI